MAKLEEEETEENHQTWRTWEELLLACAVKRHGTKNWDSVAMEIQNRTSPHFLVTPQNCKQKYYDLHTRFMVVNDDNNIVDFEDTDQSKDVKIPWLDELRKLRVAELRREVQLSDVSIVSLQLKLKRLKEEREESFREKENTDVKPDLQDKVTQVEKLERETEPGKFSPPIDVSGKPVSGDESDRDNQSFNESNSTDLKDENRSEVREKESEPIQIATGEPDLVIKDSPVDKPIGDCSYNGSTETIAKDSIIPAVKKSSAAIPVRETRKPTELWESVAESKGGGNEEGTKESSDVQSSASLSRKGNRRRKIVSGSSSGEERETDEVSPAIKTITVKSQPLIGFLEMVQSHKHGSLFESRLKIQETTKYKSLIKQHMDLETVGTRLKEGIYSGSTRKFFRDLLLLFNNAIVFFPKNSSESIAATELLELVTKELATRSRNQNLLTSEEPTLLRTPAPPPLPPLPKPDPEPIDSLLPKPIVHCSRKRSSISAKPANNYTPVEKKEDKVVRKLEEKPVLDKKQTDSSLVADQSLLNKRMGERTTSGTRSSRSNKRRKSSNTNIIMNPNSKQNSSPSLDRNSSGKGTATEDNNSETKTEKEKKNTSNGKTNTLAKKKSVENFLSRMKKNSGSPNETLLETLSNSSPVSSNNKKEDGGNKEKEEKKGGSGSGGGKKEEQVKRQNTGRKSQGREQNSPAKRSVGRPPKRAPPPPPSSSKRSRETVEQEVKPARKRRRR